MYVTSDEEGERNEQRNKDEQKQAKLEWDVRKHHHQVDLIPMEKDKGQKEEKQFRKGRASARRKMERNPE